ncbi:ATP-binding protein [Actinomycetes bacterium KLBMP 9797]
MSSPDRPVRSSPTRPGGHGPGVVDVDLPFDVDGLYALRATLAAHASRLGAPDEQIEHLLIVASELAANAIQHGGGSGRLRLWHSDGLLCCQVSDRGPGITDPGIGTSPPDPASLNGGRGLWICRNLASQLTIARGPDGRGAVITAAIPPPRPSPP